MERSNYEEFIGFLQPLEKLCLSVITGIVLCKEIQKCEDAGLPLSSIDLNQVSLETAMDEYDTVILAFPNWWATMPMAVFTFLESYDFSGKTICPLITHGGSGFSGSLRDIARLCPNAKMKTAITPRPAIKTLKNG